MLEAHHFRVPIAGMVRNFTASKALTSANANRRFAISLGVIEGVGYAAAAVVLAIYFIYDFERMRGLLYALTPRRYHLRLARILLNLGPIVGGYMRGQAITSLAIGVFTFGLLTFCGVPNALGVRRLRWTHGRDSVYRRVFSHGAVRGCRTLAGNGDRDDRSPRGWLGIKNLKSRVVVPKVYGRTLRLPSAVIILALLWAEIGRHCRSAVGAAFGGPPCRCSWRITA